MARLPSIEELNRLDPPAFGNAVEMLFERAPHLVERLAARRPYRSYEELVARAREIVFAMSEAEQAAVLGAHPRIGERPEVMSDLSRREQSGAEATEVDRELGRLQAAYEERFGFRFVVFVNRRSRAEILAVLRARIRRSRAEELRTGIEDYLAIAADRLRTPVTEAASSRHRAIAAEILAMAREDQRMRRAAAADPSSWNGRVDRRHTSRVQEIVAEIGWPTRSAVGTQASHMAWLLVQHADHDVAFQRQCLALMKAIAEAIAEDEVSQADIAYLDDRVRVHEGRPQLYGTQLHENAEGELVPGPIEDAERLDERRRTVGLGPFNEYREFVARQHSEARARPRGSTGFG